MERQAEFLQVHELNGEWRAHISEPDLQRSFAVPDFDDRAWPTVRLPHHWRRAPEFATSDGPVLYRRHFDAPDAQDGQDGRRTFLEFDGIFYFGDVYFDGDYLGATEGYFVPHVFDVTDAMRATPDHVVALEVACPPQRDRGAQRTITGGYWQTPLLDPDLNPGGVWRDVRTRTTGPLRIAGMRILCTEASAERGRLTCHLDLDAGVDARAVRLHAVVRGPNGIVLLDAWRATTVAAGANALSWTLSVGDPPRWWPRVLGPQPLVEVDIAVEAEGVASDRRVVRTAFRDVRRHGSTMLVNGERIFLKGASYGPARPLIGDADDALVRADVEQALDANLDLLRIHTHVATPALYDAADEAGLLLWQDFPMLGGYALGVRKQAARQARAMVELLGHHPSIVMWCAHDAPLGDDTPARLVANATAPTWGKEVLDRSTARAITRHDPTRPVVRSSGAADDAHLWFGWRHGDLAGLAPAIRAVPRLGRFVSAFGAQSVPNSASWLHPERWPLLDWEDLAAHHALERATFEARVPVGDAKSFDEWRDASQAYQAALLQLQIEDLRRCKGDPCGGFAVFAWADPAPAIGFGLLDHERVPKRAYATVRDACRPILPMVDPRTGNVHVVNDSPQPITDAQIEVSVDGRARRWQGDIEADAILFVARIDLDDAVDVEAVLTHGRTGRVANRYPLLVLEAGSRDR